MKSIPDTSAKTDLLTSFIIDLNFDEIILISLIINLQKKKKHHVLTSYAKFPCSTVVISASRNAVIFSCVEYLYVGKTRTSDPHLKKKDMPGK